MPRKWSKGIVVDHILKRYRNGQKLNSNHAQKKCRPLYQSACAYFGSWKKAIRAAGLRYDDIRVLNRDCPVWSRQKIIDVIQQRFSRGQPLNSNHIQTKFRKLYAASVKYFGGWPQAIKAGGLDYSQLRKRVLRSWSKATIITEIKRRHQQRLSIKGQDVSEQDTGLYHAANRHFGRGGWAKARVLAGFAPVDPLPWKIWTEQTLVEAILVLSEKGFDLSVISVLRSSHANLLGAAQNVFGSWSKAISAVGLDYSTIAKAKRNWWTKVRIMTRIKLLEKGGVRLSHRAIQIDHADLIGAAIAHFGCWSQAVEAAGIPYRRHCHVWSTKAWLRSMTNEQYNSTIERSKTHAIRRRNA